MDEHWRPQYMMSLPCIVPYTFIGKMETMARDLTYAIENMYHVNSSTFTPIIETKPTTSNISKYFNLIPLRHLHAIRQIYKLDFELFGYDSDILQIN